MSTTQISQTASALHPASTQEVVVQKTLKEHFNSIMAKCNRLKEIALLCDSKGMLKKKPQQPGRNINTHPQVSWNDNSFEYMDFIITPVKSQLPRDQEKQNITMRLSFGEKELTDHNQEQVYNIAITFRWLTQEEEWCTTQVCEYMVYSHPEVGSENLSVAGCFDNEGNLYKYGATIVEDILEEWRPIQDDLELIQQSIREFATYIAELKRQHVQQQASKS